MDLKTLLSLTSKALHSTGNKTFTVIMHPDVFVMIDDADHVQDALRPYNFCTIRINRKHRQAVGKIKTAKLKALMTDRRTSSYAKKWCELELAFRGALENPSLFITMESHAARNRLPDREEDLINMSPFPTRHIQSLITGE